MSGTKWARLSSLTLPQVARLMQVYLFRMELALRHWGVSPCHCQSSGLGRWDSGLVCDTSKYDAGGCVVPFLVILTPLVAPFGQTPQWSSCGCVVLTHGPRRTPYPSSMNETLLWLHALRTRL